MYRTVTKSLIRHQSRRNLQNLSPITAVGKLSGCLTTVASSQSSPNPQIPNDQHFKSQSQPHIPHYTDSSSSSSSSTVIEAASASSTVDELPHHDRQSATGGVGGRRSKSDYQDEQACVLQASLRHVMRLGWSESAMIAGAREIGLSPSIVGSFSRKEAALVEFFMDDCLQKLIDTIDSGEVIVNTIPSECISKLVRIRLEMQAPFISKWPEALSIQAQPLNVPTSFKQRAMLIDEIWHAVGDEASDLDWYVKRTILGGIYSATEVYMLTDNSPEFRDTWAFLSDRVRDAFDLKKTMQEAKYLAEAVGAGMGGSLDGFMKRAFR